MREIFFEFKTGDKDRYHVITKHEYKELAERQSAVEDSVVAVEVSAAEEGECDFIG